MLWSKKLFHFSLFFLCYPFLIRTNVRFGIHVFSIDFVSAEILLFLKILILICVISAKPELFTNFCVLFEIEKFDVEIAIYNECAKLNLLKAQLY